MTEIVFVGGGNMAAALIGGLLRSGMSAGAIGVVEVDAARRDWLKSEFGVAADATADAAAEARIVVLAVKPQQMTTACAALRPYVARQVIVSIAAGTRARDIARWLRTTRIVRAMPNTPALVGQGITGMAALEGADAAERAAAERVLAVAGPVVWFDDEAALDAVTALSGSGPAYVFYFIEALIDAGQRMGLAAAQARELAIATFAGATHLAASSSESPAVLRERVTSKGGTTAAALACMHEDGLAESIVRAVLAAHRRAIELGDEFGAD